ncbi:MAG: hypothetical protein ACT4NX_01865 [Deltaproteobacteria bacterium]
MSVSRRAALFGLFGFAITLIIQDADARGRRRAGFRTRGLSIGARHKGPVLARDQLSQCVKEQNAINASGDQVDQLQASIAANAVKINRLETEITAQEGLVDVYSQDSIDSFNALVDRHRQLVAAHNNRLPDANARVEQVNAAVARFNAKCADRAYYQYDMDAVLVGK